MITSQYGGNSYGNNTSKTTALSEDNRSWVDDLLSIIKDTGEVVETVENTIDAYNKSQDNKNNQGFNFKLPFVTDSTGNPQTIRTGIPPETLMLIGFGGFALVFVFLFLRK